MDKCEKIRKIFELNSDGTINEKEAVILTKRVLQIIPQTSKAKYKKGNKRIKWTHWSDMDKNLLTSSYKQGMPIAEIAKTLGRTLEATKYQLSSLRSKGEI